MPIDRNYARAAQEIVVQRDELWIKSACGHVSAGLDPNSFPWVQEALTEKWENVTDLRHVDTCLGEAQTPPKRVSQENNDDRWLFIVEPPERFGPAFGRGRELAAGGKIKLAVNRFNRLENPPMTFLSSEWFSFMEAMNLVVTSSSLLGKELRVWAEKSPEDFADIAVRR